MVETGGPRGNASPYEVAQTERSANFTALVVMNDVIEPTLQQIYDGVKDLNPTVTVGDRSGEFATRPSSSAPASVVRINDVDLLIWPNASPLPPEFISRQRYSNILWPKEWPALNRHNAHIGIRPLDRKGAVRSLVERVSTARATLLLAYVVSTIADAPAIRWDPADNIFREAQSIRIAPR